MPTESTDALLARRRSITESLSRSPYDPILYLRRADIHVRLLYPDLAAGDAYRALLLADEALMGFEYRENAVSALLAYSLGDAFASLTGPGTCPTSDEDLASDVGDPASPTNALATRASFHAYRILSYSLTLCGCLRSARDFCEKGLLLSPRDEFLLARKEAIMAAARQRTKKDDPDPSSLPDAGLVRREVYPWNDHEPDRFSEESLIYLNDGLETMALAPKCEVRVATLPVLDDAPVTGSRAPDGDRNRRTRKRDDAATANCKQLGLFAREDITPGEVVLREYSLLTASSRLKGSTCDACHGELPPLAGGGVGVGSPREQRGGPVNCPDCQDTVFCDEFCLAEARQRYHPALCDKGDLDTVAKDPAPNEAVDALYLLLLVRVLAIARHEQLHPLQVREVKYIWGGLASPSSPPAADDDDPAAGAGAASSGTALPFSFKYGIWAPLHALEKMEVDVYEELAYTDLWVLNTLYAKFRGTASARKSTRDGVPDVAAVHPFWCLANHDCDPNVTWEWGGRMVLSARETRVVGGAEAGLRKGEEVLNHYCDVDMPVRERREWARGSLGGWCMCGRCRREEEAGGAG